MVKGGTVDQALALKDTTRHKQPAGKGSWISLRKQEEDITISNDEVNGKKMKGILTILDSVESKEKTTIGGFTNTSTSTSIPTSTAVVHVPASHKESTYTVRSRSKTTDDTMVTTISKDISYYGKSQRDLEDAEFNDAFSSISSTGGKALQFDYSENDILTYDGEHGFEEKSKNSVENDQQKDRNNTEMKKNANHTDLKKEKVNNTGLGGFNKNEIQSIGLSNQTRLNLINSGATPTFLRATSVPYVEETPYLHAKSDLPQYPNWNPKKGSGKDILTPQELDKKDSERHGMMKGKGAWVSYRVATVPINVITPDKKKVIKLNFIKLFDLLDDYYIV